MIPRTQTGPDYDPVTLPTVNCRDCRDFERMAGSSELGKCRPGHWRTSWSRYAGYGVSPMVTVGRKCKGFVRND